MKLLDAHCRLLLLHHHFNFVTCCLQGFQGGVLTGTFSTEECSDVAENMLQYVNSMPPPLLDSSSSPNNNTASLSLAPPLQDHVTSPSTAKTLPQGLLSHMTPSSSQFSDHVIQAPRFLDHMIPKLPSFPNPTTNNDRYANITMTTCM